MRGGQGVWRRPCSRSCHRAAEVCERIPATADLPDQKRCKLTAHERRKYKEAPPAKDPGGWALDREVS
jgi:hypothetical protein